MTGILVRQGTVARRERSAQSRRHIGLDRREHLCLHDAQGRITSHFVIHREITEQEKTGERLRLSEEFARNLIESSMDMIIAVDRDRKMIQSGRAAEGDLRLLARRGLGPTSGHPLCQPAREMGGEQPGGRKRRERADHPQSTKEWEDLSQPALRLGSAENPQGESIGVMGVALRFPPQSKRTPVPREGSLHNFSFHSNLCRIRCLLG